MRKEHKWQYAQEHADRALYARYHTDIFLPDDIRRAAEAFLPDKGTPLKLSDHYQRIQEKRRLPSSLFMPYTYDIIEVIVMRATGAIFRVVVRGPWNDKVDIVLSLEGDFEVVTAFWARANNWHNTLDTEVYERGGDQ